MLYITYSRNRSFEIGPMTKNNEGNSNIDKAKKLIQRLTQVSKDVLDNISEFIAEKPKMSAVIIGVIAFFIANQLLLFPIFSPELGEQRQISNMLQAMYSEKGSFMFFSFWSHLGVALTVYLLAKFTIEKVYKK